MMRVTLLLLALASPWAALAQATAPPPLAAGEVKLTLRDATHLAVAQNLGLEIARTNPQIARQIEGQARGAYDPLAFSDYTFEHSEDPVASPVQSFFNSPNKISADTWRYTGGLAGILPVGITYSSSYVFQRVDSDSGFNALEREYRPVWASELKLPLLRDLIYNEANVTVMRTEILRQISDEGFRKTLMDTLVGVELAYWGLAARRADESVAAKSLETARDLLEQTRVQYEVGVVSKVNVSQAEAGEALREYEFVTAQTLARTAQDRLLDLIAQPDLETYEKTRVITEDPAFVDYEINEEVSLARAQELRPELQQARRAVEEAELQLKYARNQRLPRLDVTGGYTLQGLSGPSKTTLSDPNDPTSPMVPVVRGIPSSSWAADDGFFHASGAHGWSLGGRVEIPIGNHSARSLVAQREVELRRARTALKRQEQDLILDVRNAARKLRAAIQGIQSAERGRVAQQDSLRAEQERLRLGDSTPFQVLQFEEDLVDAERQLIAALYVYREAITEIERAQGTILEARGVVFEEELERQ